MRSRGGSGKLGAKRGWHWSVMQYHLKQAIIIPKHERQIAFLRMATRRHSVTGEDRGILIHAPGGYPLKGDLRDMIHKGWLVMQRRRQSLRTSKTYLHITDKGREELAKHG